MNLARKLSIVVVCGVPAIIGGCLAYHYCGGYPAAAVWELALYAFAANVFSS